MGAASSAGGMCEPLSKQLWYESGSVAELLQLCCVEVHLTADAWKFIGRVDWAYWYCPCWFYDAWVGAELYEAGVAAKLALLICSPVGGVGSLAVGCGGVGGSEVGPSGIGVSTGEPGLPAGAGLVVLTGGAVTGSAMRKSGTAAASTACSRLEATDAGGESAAGSVSMCGGGAGCTAVW
jgi:hypothetical protein